MIRHLIWRLRQSGILLKDFHSGKKKDRHQNHADFKVFMVNHRDMEHALTFYKSQVNRKMVDGNSGNENRGAGFCGLFTGRISAGLQP